MSAEGGFRQRLRGASEEHLRIAAMRAMRKKYADVETRAPNYARNPFWDWVFVPVYKRLPWGLKTTMMKRSGMIAAGWTPPARKPGTPWTPPAPPPPKAD